MSTWICLINSVHKHILNTLVLPSGLPSITENTVFKRCFWRCALGPISDAWLWVMKTDKDNSLHLKSLLSQFVIPETEPLEVCDSSQLLEQNCGPEVSPKWRYCGSFQGLYPEVFKSNEWIFRFHTRGFCRASKGIVVHKKCYFLGF